MEVQQQQQECKWLVKSNSSVTGPFRFNDVVEAIFKGDIHVLDEIKGPFERWRPIRDHSLFNAAIEKLKASTYSRRENTMTDNIDFATQDITQNVDSGLDESTATNIPLADLEVGEAQGKPAEGVSIPGNGMGHQVDDNEGSSPKIYANPHPPMARFPYAIFTAFVFVFSGLFGYFYLQMKNNPQPAVTRTDLAFQHTDLGEQALKQGDFMAALKQFRKASELKPTDPDIALVKAPLEMHFGTDVKTNIDYVEKVLAGNIQANIAQGKNIVGLGYAVLGDYRAAIQHYDLALAKDDSYFAAWVNKGYALIAMGRPEEAIAVLNEAIQLSAKDGYFARYLLIRAYVTQGINSQKEAAFQEAIEHANYFINRLKAFDLRQEVMFFKAVALKNTGVPREELNLYLRRMLSIDPELTGLHSHDINWDFESFNWKEFSDECHRLTNSLGVADGDLLAGFCAYKRGETLTAKNKFERQLRKKQKDGVLRGLITATLSSRKDEDAQAALAFHDRIDEKNLFADVIMRECLQKNDIECADKVQVMLENKVNILYQNWYQAEKFKESQKSLALKALGNGLDISYHFIPFLRLKKDL